MDSKLFEAYENAIQKKTRIQIPYIKGDFIDRLHSRYTTTVLLIILGLLVLQQYNGSPIMCWLSGELNDNQVAYVHDLCWVNNTYHYPLESDPDKFPDHNKNLINYYQYILFIISGQILLFFLPSFFWKLVTADSGGYINDMINKCNKKNLFDIYKQEKSKLEKKEKERREQLEVQENENKNLFEEDPSSFTPRAQLTTQEDNSHEDSVLIYMSQNLKPEFSKVIKKRSKSYEKLNHADQSSTKRTKLKMFKHLSNFTKPIKGAEKLAFYYFSLKVLNLLNVLTQIIGLRFIFGHDFYRYGLDFFNKFVYDENQILFSKQFPILTICDYYVHQNLRKIHYNSTLCLLYINFLIEKFFVIIWFWLFALLLLTSLNILSWIIEVFSPSYRYSFLSKYINIKENMREKKTKQDRIKVDYNSIDNFYKRDLGKDGIIMLHLLKNAAGDIFFIDILGEFWREFRSHKEN